MGVLGVIVKPWQGRNIAVLFWGGRTTISPPGRLCHPRQIFSHRQDL